MKQIYPLVAFAVVLAGLFFFFANWQVTTDQPGGPQLVPRDNPAANAGGGLSLPFGLGQQTPPASGNLSAPPLKNAPAAPQNMPVSVPGNQKLGGDMIRIASFNIQVFGEEKIAHPDVVRVLADIVRHFDIVAIQEIRDERQSLLPTFLQAINAPGLRYDYVVGPRLGRTTSKEQYGYVFNTDTIEVDRRTVYTVADPDDLLHREPLVASFRCRRADPSQAFTFTLVDIHTDPTPQTLREELTVLDDVFRSVRNDPRGEDDVILLGDFNASHQQMGELSRMANVFFAISTVQGKLLATNVIGKSQYDNLIFDRVATQEYLGRSGVFDFLREYNLSQAQAKQVSDHLPVWAEFSIYEGGVPGRVAAAPSRYPRQTDPYQPRYAQGTTGNWDNTPAPPSFNPYPPNEQGQGYDYQTRPNYTADQRYYGTQGNNRDYSAHRDPGDFRRPVPAQRW